MKYTLKAGDSLSSIAKRFLGDARKYPLIAVANHLTRVDMIPVGTELEIPGAASEFAETVAVRVPPASLPGSRLGLLNEQRLAKVHPALAARAKAMVELLAQGGTEILITQGLRTWEEQDALYSKGRTSPPIGKQSIVTNAKGGQSYHNFGLAVDIVVLDSIGKADWDTNHPGWAAAAKTGKSVGLAWGGDWKSFKDLPHFQHTGGLDLGRCRNLYAEGGLAAVWSEVA